MGSMHRDYLEPMNVIDYVIITMGYYAVQVPRYFFVGDKVEILKGVYEHGKMHIRTAPRGEAEKLTRLAPLHWICKEIPEYPKPEQGINRRLQADIEEACYAEYG